MNPAPGAQGWLARLPTPARWAALIALSVAFAAILEMVGLPAALLMGPMVAGAVFGTNGAVLRLPRLPFLCAQAIVGCLIAHAMTADILVNFLKDWPLFLAIVLAVVAACSVLGWLMTRRQILPGTTAIWGLSPGAASAMMIVAEAYGADTRLVAFMQYLRVMFVAIAASIIGRFWLSTATVAPPQIVWFPAIDSLAFAQTLAIASVGVAVGRFTRIPAGTLMAPLIIGSALQIGGVVRIELPEWLLAISYLMLGWNIGLGFTRAILGHAWRALPQILLAIFLLIGFCGFLAFVLTRLLGVDPLTAYLATTPGGMDSVAIIAASSKQVDMPFVMALQTVRFVIVILIGPSLARIVARFTTRA